MAKYLNVDDLAPEKRVLTLNGQDHEMHPVTVQEYIEIARVGEKAQAGDLRDMSPTEQIDYVADQIVKAFPTVPREELMALTMPQLSKVIAFTVGQLEEESELKSQVEPGKKKPTKAVK